MADQQDKLEQELRGLGELASSRRSAGDAVMRRVRELPAPAARARVIRWRLWGPVGAAAAAVLVAACALWLSMARQTPPLGVQVSELAGTVLMNAQGARHWLPVCQGQDLRAGDRLHVMPGSHARLLLPDQSWVELAPGALVTLKRAGDRIEVSLSSGRIRAASDRPHASVVVRTPWAQVEPLGTDFSVQVDN